MMCMCGMSLVGYIVGLGRWWFSARLSSLPVAVRASVAAPVAGLCCVL